jgi:hypothetical protein
LISRLGCVSFGIVLSLAAISASAQYGVPLNRTDPKLEPATVRELVNHYCRVDYAGARLNPSDWPKIGPFVSWKTNPEFPLFMVTSRFDVDPAVETEHNKYVVIVHYRLLGKYDLGEGYFQESPGRVQNVQFTVAEVNGDWRISDAEPSYPHVSSYATVQWINQRLAETKDPVTKTIYQSALDRLQPQKPASAAQ